MEEPDYYKVDALNSGLIKTTYYENMGIAKAKRDDQKSDTKALIFGRAFHLKILEPQKYDDAICEMQTKAGKKEIEEALNADLLPLNVDELESLDGMAKAIKQSPIQDYLEMMDAVEQDLYWTDKKTGLKCKARVDGYAKPDEKLGHIGFVGDIKTCATAHPKDFARDAAKYSYFIQAQWYRNAAKEVLGIDVPFYFFCVEKTKPYATGIFDIDDMDLVYAQNIIDNVKLSYAECRVADDWCPDYSLDKSDIHTLSLPPWARRVEL